MAHRTWVKLVLGWIFGRYPLGFSCDFTEVRPVLAAGGQLAHLTEPHTESLETDLGTVIKLLSIIILIQNSDSDSKPATDCISKLDEWDTAFCSILVLSLFYEY